jgi:hypothetical protein
MCGVIFLLCCPTLAALQYTLTLRKPLGLHLAEQPGLAGLSVGAVLPEGSAGASERVWPGDLLVGINGRELSEETSFESAMLQLQSASPTADLTFCRDLSRVVAVRFPTGAMAFGSPGDSLDGLALAAGYDGIQYDCRAGTCGVCEVVLRTGDKARTIRACSGKVPRCETAEPHGVLSAREAAGMPTPPDLLKLQAQLKAEAAAQERRRGWPW